ncbi:MAG: hypothetical protein NC341_09060 [Blautia sp.]|nr:hypothetical protein [Blautia sp.]MCM1201861.1 hypothetical protein [Bacteroides fragilis]
MAVTGIGQGNGMAYRPFPQKKNYRGSGRAEFNEALYGNGAAEQNMAGAFRTTDTDPLSAALQNVSARVCGAWGDTVWEKGRKVQEMGGGQAYLREGRLTGGIIGSGTLDDGTAYSAGFAANSTIGNPVIEIRMQRKGGREELYMVSPRNVDPARASQLEMFGLCAYADSQGLLGESTGAGSYQKLLAYAKYGAFGDNRAKTADAFMAKQRDWNSYVTDDRIEKLGRDGKVEESWGRALQSIFGKMERQNADKAKTEGRSESELQMQAVADTLPVDNGVPYYYLAKDGIIDYNGVVFVCDAEHKALCLGDTSDKSKCLSIPLSGGGSLIVNRDNLDSLAKAIGMFSPEDVNLIMRAIAEDAKIRQMKQQIDDETSGLDLAEQTGGDGGEEEPEMTAEESVAKEAAKEDEKAVF